MFRSKWLKIKNDVAQYLTQYSKTKKATSNFTVTLCCNKFEYTTKKHQRPTKTKYFLNEDDVIII